MERLNVLITPPGRFGLAMAVPFAFNNHDVTLGFRSNAKADTFDRTHKDERLPGIEFPADLRVSSDFKSCIPAADIVVLAVPSDVLRQFYLRSIMPYLRQDALLLCLTKGWEEGTNLPASEVILDLHPEVKPRLSILAGPNFAQEMAQGLPMATVIASMESPVEGKPSAAEQVVQALSNRPLLRAYSSNDVRGVEIGSGLKNVIAIAAGISDGLGKKESARASLITRGFFELVSVGIRLGGGIETLNGLSGQGDLWLTATSYQSRNHWAGVELARGKTLKDLQNSGKTIEGINTSKVMVELADKYNLEAPICRSVYKILFENLIVEEAARQLMGRTPTSENHDR